MGYRLSNEAKNDLIRIHQFGAAKFGVAQADKYFNAFFKQFDLIAKRPYSYEAVNHIKQDYRRCVCGIFYRIENNVIEIMAIIGRQDLNKIF